ncbi:MAG: aminotransferase class I/II-fold pyridoxal phosphate-dependent enzyme [Candidatus Hydrogenedentota bacterium]
MKERLSKVVREIKPSGIRKFFDLVMNTPDIVSLGVGEPDFSTPWGISEYAIHKIEKGFTSYTSNYGLTDLRDAICEYLNNRFHCSYKRENVLVTVGSSEALDIVLRGLINPGDEIIILEPCFVSYYPLIKLAYGTPVVVPLDPQRKFHPDFKALNNKITKKTKAIIVSYPNNPTGSSLKKEELEKLIDIAIKNDLYIISDELYAELTYDGEYISFGSFKKIKSRLMLISGLSKAWAMTGWRIGYVCAPSEIIEMIVKIHQYSIMCAPVMAQFAAIEALKNGNRDKDEMVEEYNTRRKFIYKGLKDIGFDVNLPEGAFYIFPSIKETGMKSERFCLKLLAKEKVAVVPGTAFGDYGEGYIRCSYASSFEEIEIALDHINKFYKNL